MDNLTDVVTEVKPKKARAKRKVKEISILDESITRDFKKNRIGSKVSISPNIINDDSEKLNYILDKIYDLIESADEDNKKYIYILDKLYPDGNICFLTGPIDSFTIVVNNMIVFNDLKMHRYVLTDYSKIYFYDSVNGLTEQS